MSNLLSKRCALLLLCRLLRAFIRRSRRTVLASTTAGGLILINGVVRVPVGLMAVLAFRVEVAARFQQLLDILFVHSFQLFDGGLLKRLGEFDEIRPVLVN